jgi:NAD(P)H-hydrate epimerase
VDLQRITSLPPLPGRATDAHKGSFGRVLVVGGSRGMVGAVALAANSALRGGAGLVTFAAPEAIQLAVAELCPCATSTPLDGDSAGMLSPAGAQQAMEIAAGADVLAIGPGLGVGQGPQELVAAALGQDKPTVLDADGLNNLTRIENWPKQIRCPLILTPHPGEFSRLTGLAVKDFQSDRESAAVEAGRNWAGRGGAPVCVLKGAGTVVTDGQRIYVNDTGNPGMATGGSGDVLTGLIAALIGQGMTCFDAACLGVWAHGRAGDLAAEEKGQASVIATDILESVPAALLECSS